MAAICGNTTLWKPSSLTPLCAIAVQNICNEVTSSSDFPNIFSLAIGSGSKIGESLIKDEKVPLISFTGSTRMGRHVSEVVSRRFDSIRSNRTIDDSRPRRKRTTVAS